MEIKDESIKNKNELEKETKERRAELQRYEKRVLSKEETLDKKADAIEKREAGFAAKEEQLRQRETIYHTCIFCKHIHHRDFLTRAADDISFERKFIT